MTPAKITKSFLRSTITYTMAEEEWIKAMYRVIYKVAQRNSQFTVDDVWAEFNKQASSGKITPNRWVDHRILGPMIRHMVSMGDLSSTGYFTKSTRPGGGSRPVTIWQSHIVRTTKAAA